MNSKHKDRIVDVVLILVFLTILAASAYGLIKIIITWKVKGLG